MDCEEVYIKNRWAADPEVERHYLKVRGGGAFIDSVVDVAAAVVVALLLLLAEF